MQESDMMAKLEALLFYHGEPISREDIAKFLEISKKEVQPLIESYNHIVNARKEGGLELLVSDSEIQLVTKKQCAEIFKKLQDKELREDLTPAALETLSVVAYLGPLTRPEIDYVRGVNSSFMVRGLVLRGLLKRSVGGKRGAFAYSASFEFLKHMGIRAQEELPEYEKYKGLLQRLREQNVEIKV